MLLERTVPTETAVPSLSGAQIVVRALLDAGVDTVFGYPGGAVLPIYDALFHEPRLRHVLVRHEQGATHAAEGYARSTGKPGVVLVTSGPGATNAVTGIVDALMDSIPMVVLTGQVPTHLIGSDAFQECDTVGITRSCTKHNMLVRRTEDLGPALHEAFHIATSGRPGPVLIDIPKDVQVGRAAYVGPLGGDHARRYRPRVDPDRASISRAVELLAKAERPIIYAGGGVINAGPDAARALTSFARATGAPVTATLMGLGAFPASDPQWLGMLGMHGSYEANHAMHDCDVMLCVGARFDDRVTGRVEAFSPGSRKIHIDIDPSSIGKIVSTEIGIVADAGRALQAMLEMWEESPRGDRQVKLRNWWTLIEERRRRRCFAYRQAPDRIMPQYAIERLEALTRDRDRYITTEVGQHQMWAAQYLRFEEPNRWMTSGGLGTMGYGLPAAIGVQLAHPDALVIDVAGEASIQMCMQELSTAVQHRAPVKVMIINNEWMGMVRQWQQLLHGERYSHSYSESLPDFVKLAEAYGATGLRVDHPDALDDAIRAMIDTPGPVLLDCRVVRDENCLPMIASGKAHNDMLVGDGDAAADIGSVIDESGRGLV
jgi:acetolactate synthase-1/2/3 large subunit